MTVADLKLKIFRQVDSLEKNRLEEVYGMHTNYLSGSKSLDEWNQLAEEQKSGIFAAMEDIDEGKGVQHDKVMKRIRKKNA